MRGHSTKKISSCVSLYTLRKWEGFLWSKHFRPHSALFENGRVFYERNVLFISLGTLWNSESILWSKRFLSVLAIYEIGVLFYEANVFFLSFRTLWNWQGILWIERLFRLTWNLLKIGGFFWITWRTHCFEQSTWQTIPFRTPRDKQFQFLITKLSFGFLTTVMRFSKFCLFCVDPVEFIISKLSFGFLSIVMRIPKFCLFRVDSVFRLSGIRLATCGAWIPAQDSCNS